MDQQKPTVLYYPNLETHAMWDTSRFSWVKTLEESVDIIREELNGLLKTKSGFQIIYPKSKDKTFQTDEGAWAVSWFFIYGLRNKRVIDKCPQTTALLSSIPNVEQAGLSIFSSMAPGTHLQAHSGTTNAKLRVNLPLITQESRIRVGSHIHLFEEGKVFIFDDSFEHEVFESGSKPRFSLLFDIYHPDLTPAQIKEVSMKVNPTSAEKYRYIMEKHGKNHDVSWVYE